MIDKWKHRLRIVLPQIAVYFRSKVFTITAIVAQQLTSAKVGTSDYAKVGVTTFRFCRAN